MNIAGDVCSTFPSLLVPFSPLKLRSWILNKGCRGRTAWHCLLGWQSPSLTTALYHLECAQQLPTPLGTQRATGLPGAALPCIWPKFLSQWEREGGERGVDSPLYFPLPSKLPTSRQYDTLPEVAEDQLIWWINGNYFVGLSALPLWILIAISVLLFCMALEPASQITRAGHCPGPLTQPPLPLPHLLQNFRKEMN